MSVNPLPRSVFADLAKAMGIVPRPAPPPPPEKIDLSAHSKPNSRARARTRWRQHHRVDGTEKTAYHTSEYADKMARKLREAPNYTPKEGIEPTAYMCETCGKWHVGNMETT